MSESWLQKPDEKQPSVWDLVLKDLDKLNFPNPIQQEVKNLVIADILRISEVGAVFGDSAIESAYNTSLQGCAKLRQSFEERRTNRVITQDRALVLSALSDMYKTQVQISLGLRYALKIEKEQNESFVDTGDNRGTEEFRQHQSNIVIPEG